MIAYLESREKELVSWGAKEIPNTNREKAKDAPSSNKRKLVGSDSNEPHSANRKKVKLANEPVAEKLDNRVLVQGLNYETNYNDVKDFFQSVGKSD